MDLSTLLIAEQTGSAATSSAAENVAPTNISAPETLNLTAKPTETEASVENEVIVTHVPTAIPVDLQPITQPGAVVVMTEKVAELAPEEVYETVYNPETDDNMPMILKVFIGLVVVALAAGLVYISTKI